MKHFVAVGFVFFEILAVTRYIFRHFFRQMEDKRLEILPSHSTNIGTRLV